MKTTPSEDSVERDMPIKKFFFAFMSGSLACSGIDYLVNGKIWESVVTLTVSFILMLVHEEMLKRP